ncbi:hypothetical protein GJW-30_1_01306 [Variibacter gotjawalensis]|uniref:Uncharacterized protein n=1 Tax=Variibacter gotjawalensis TaxID=1333996 RepID=A0A0S3PS67_9BRAD|nr:hypothetical protein [Variibacter gotjawalensis]RZS50945.1 hypothetical protein EV661_3417 [Variibacter gotjawalensis]BAT58779.1 hypothetical protein GJW-30_1_01306 [Variibacter gotjawalensis]
MEPTDKAQANRNLAAESLRLSRQKQREPSERELDLRLAKTYKSLAESREYLERAAVEVGKRTTERPIPPSQPDAHNDA